MLCSAIALISTSAFAQAAADTDSPGGDIVVTARKRSEDVLKTPITVSVVTSEDIAKRGITSLSDLATNTPGVTINNNSSGRADRSFQQIILRGFVPSTSLSTTASTFIDGAPVASPTALTSITDPARIEVLKGPQSAYFGRNTFAGAVNVVNKEPGNEWHGMASAMGGSRSNYRFHADIEGPIIKDGLFFRLNGDLFSKDGSYRDPLTGDTLGDQSSKSVSGLIVAKPTSSLTLKVFGIYSQDNDGPAATGLLGTRSVTDSNGQTVVANQSNCSFNGYFFVSGVKTPSVNPTLCGVTPGVAGLSPSSNTRLTDGDRAFLADGTGRVFAGKDGVQGYGLLRRFYHIHGNIDWEIPDTGVTLSSITAMNREGYSTFVDLDNYNSVNVAAVGGGSYNYPFLVERRNSDFSQEVRAAFDNGGPLKATVGASYLNNWVTSDLGGGPGYAIRPTVAGKTQSRTKGAFFALSYKFFDKLTLNAEGRYQIDTLYAFAGQSRNSAGALVQGINVPATSATLAPGFYSVGTLLARQTYKNFLPRVIAQYEFSPYTMIYASWSKGVNPGGFNTSFLTAPPATIAIAESQGVRITVRPEKVTNYEIGIKGKLLGGRLRYALDGYFAQWRDQINSLAIAGNDPVTGVPQLVQGTANTGNADMKGIELETTYVASDLITLNGAVSMNDSKILTYRFPTTSQLTGVENFAGNQLPFTSKWSATAGIQFGGEMRNMDNASWFARADYAYKSGVYSNAANILRTPHFQNVNVRVGGTVGAFSLEMFINNLFNDRAYTSINDQFLFVPGNLYNSINSAVNVGMRELRTAGFQAKVKF
ncbi:MAG TPA: TonB-dependent receptor [Sphingobium sp.]